MKTYPFGSGVSTLEGPGSGAVTRERARARARELARIAGRAPAFVTQADYESAKRELTGESDFDRQEAILDAVSGDVLADFAG
jgi:hypothetical protein